jgi:hypothetical protein
MFVVIMFVPAAFNTGIHGIDQQRKMLRTADFFIDQHPEGAGLAMQHACHGVLEWYDIGLSHYFIPLA